MSYTNELTIRGLQLIGTDKNLIRELQIIDREIDSIFRAGGTSREAREPQQRFNTLLPPP
ncbi:hypothetical protein [Arthrobacter flavus]|uniref:Uncharacterized protein n=1 Tax=Arthrobacter flavus TaxID=95172 RepID=A0ABW4Q5N3_9MICC